MPTHTLPDNDAPAIQVGDLLFRFSPSAAPVLDVPAWRVARGERVFLQGDSGSGKSTLLGLLAGLLVRTRGAVSILGTDLGLLSVRQRDAFRARHIGVVFQQFNLIPYLSVLDNVLLAAQFGSSGAASARSRAIELLHQMNLESALHTRPARQLSMGQQQRVAIVRSLINMPALLLVDEPTSALDHSNRDAFLKLLLEALEATGSAMVFVSHDPTIGSYFDQHVAIAELNRVGVPA